MGSRVDPYFILTAEKVRGPNERRAAENKHEDCAIQENVTNAPTTPPPSGVSGKTGPEAELNIIPKILKKKKYVYKYKSPVPVKANRTDDSASKKMELIKEKLERSRKRFNDQKLKPGEIIDAKCEQTNRHSDDDNEIDAFKGAVTDADPMRAVVENTRDTNSPYIYFVVSEEDAADVDEKMLSKSAGKRRRLRIVEDNRLKRDRKECQTTNAKRIGLARELGLKSSLVSKSEHNQGSLNRPAVNHIVFQGPEHEPLSKSPQGKVTRTAHSPPRIPPCTPATMLTTLSEDIKLEPQTQDPDENVPRKPFLSGPLYSGKNRGTHAFSLQHFELPIITPEQKRRALGLGTKFDDFAYPKPQSEQKQRKVSFAEPLPVIRGSGFVLNTNDVKDGYGMDIPTLGRRAVTMGSIVLPSERLDKQSMCQRYLAGEQMSSARNVKKLGVLIPLPKIDIVSNVYDEMIIKMIKEYLQDTNTPSRQSQLARELLLHLQKHDEHMQEINVPNMNQKNKTMFHKEAAIKHQQRARQLFINFAVPPNTAEAREPNVMPTIADISESFDINAAVAQDVPEFEDSETNRITSANNPRSIPFVQITFKHKEDVLPETEPVVENDEVSIANSKATSKNTENDKKSNGRPYLSAVTPVSFQMAPPGLSKEDSFVAMPSKA